MKPLVAIPTTAGTGSEVTSAAVIRNEQSDRKMSFLSNRLCPHVAIVDPVMMMTMPPRLTAATGMDALTHAIEGYYCLCKNPVSDSFLRAAVALIRDHLAEAVRHGENEEARVGMANGALLAGIGFSNSMVGVVHSMAHAAGGVAHVPHGVGNGILLPFGMEQNLQKRETELAQLAHLLGLPIAGRSDRDRALLAIDWVRDLQRTLNDLCGLPIRLRDAGVEREQLAEIAKATLDDGSLTYNPEDATYEEVLAMLQRAY
jgi:alcohol dehydrogenase